MKKFLFLTATALIGFVFWQCSDSSTNPDKEVRELTAPEKSLAQSSNKFGLKLFGEIAAGQQNSNIFISPLSVSMALGMTYNGADGETKDAMEETLELQGLSLEEINQSYQSLIELLTGLDPRVIFEIANSIWYREGFLVLQDFIDLNQEYFDAEVAALDFGSNEAAGTMNGWVDEKTHGKISKIIQPPINPLTMMFLINAIYFKGDWTYQFEKTATKEEDFYLEGGGSDRCLLMSQNEEFSYFSNEMFQAIDLPYGDSDFSMTIFLPQMYAGVTTDDVIAAVNSENLETWLGSFQKREVDLYLPKFELEYKIKLNDVLTALGMGIAFNMYNADFTRMYESEEYDQNLYISQVLHKTYVKVDEEGTEAAAVTVVEMTLTSAQPDTPVVMRIDHPFVFLIRDHHSNTILFMGKIINPGIPE